MKKLFTLLSIAVLFSCSSDDNKQVKEDPIIYKYGYDQSKYVFEERKEEALKEIFELKKFFQLTKKRKKQFGD